MRGSPKTVALRAVIRRCFVLGTAVWMVGAPVSAQRSEAAEEPEWPESPRTGRMDKVELEGMELHPWRGRAWFHLAVPKDYTPKEEWPLVVVLHGGPNGSPNQIGGYFRRGLMEKGVISVYPNALVNQLLDWNYPHTGGYLLSLLDQIGRTYRIDPRRIYLVGVSMGGGGAWVQGALFRDVFAAIGPISGWYGASQSPDVELLKDMPVYALHGENDRHVPASRARLAFTELEKIGRTSHTVKEDFPSGDMHRFDRVYREIPGAGHNCFRPWKTRGAPELGRMMDWLLNKRRERPADFAAAGKLLAEHGKPFGWRPGATPVGTYIRSEKPDAGASPGEGVPAGSEQNPMSESVRDVAEPSEVKGPAAFPAASSDQPVELGRIDWSRDFEAAKSRAAVNGKPLMVFFGEIPGCGGCTRFGREMLSHPLVVDAAHEGFVPVAIRNNSENDADAEWVEHFSMPRWAYPEVRFLDPGAPNPKGDLVPREPKGWRKITLPGRMAAALKKAEQPVPNYLQLLVEEAEPDNLERACFWMMCYWTGEAKLSGVDGIHAMRIGWLDGKEVVEIDFDPGRTSFEDLARLAKTSCGRKVGVFARTDDQLKEAQKLEMPVKRTREKVDPRKVRQKRYLMVRQPDIWLLPLTELQAVRLNALVAAQAPVEKLEELLSPSQNALRTRLRERGPARDLLPVLLKEIGAPERDFTGAAAWNRKLDAFLATP